MVYDNFKCPYEKSLETYRMPLVYIYMYIYIYIYIYIYMCVCVCVCVCVCEQDLILNYLQGTICWKTFPTNVFTSLSKYLHVADLLTVRSLDKPNVFYD